MFPNQRQFLIRELSIAGLDCWRRLHAFHWAAINIAATDRPTEHPPEHRENITTIGRLMFGHSIKDSNDIGPGNLRQWLAAEHRLYMYPERSTDQNLPATANARRFKAVGIVAEREIDRFAATLFLDLNWVDALGDEQEKALGLFSGRCRCPGGAMTANGITPRNCFAPTHPKLHDIRYGAALGDLSTKPPDPVIPQKAL
jgi:hypothetical protein